MTVAFAVVNAISLHLAPYATPNQPVAVSELKDVAHGRDVTSPANLSVSKEQLKSFDRLAAVREASNWVGGDGEPEQVGVMIASPAYSRGLDR